MAFDPTTAQPIEQGTTSWFDQATAQPIIEPDPSASSSMSPVAKATQIAGQFVKAIYTNPLVHPALKALSDITGSKADEAYAALPEAQGVMEKVAQGVGAAIPTVAIASPIMRGVEGILGAAESLPMAFGKLASFLKDSDLAKSAITGLAYGKSEAMAINAQGGKVDENQYAKDTAGQFLMWGAFSKGGATLAAKLLPKELPLAQQVIARMPNALKQAYTPEGLGTIAGGAVAGAISAPDKNSGIAGVIVGGALSAMNPMEQTEFRKGMGKTIGVDGVSALTDRWGPQFQNANVAIKNNGWDKVEQVGQLVLPNGENAVHLAAKTQIEDYDSVWKDLHAKTQPVLQSMDNKAISGQDTLNLVDKIKYLIDNKFRTPGYLSKTKAAFDSAYPALQVVELPTSLAQKYGIAPSGYKGATFRTSISELGKVTDTQVRNSILQKVAQAQMQNAKGSSAFTSGKAPLYDVSFQALDELRQTMSKISQSNDAYEAGTSGQIAKMISEHMKAKSQEYTGLMSEWSGLFKVGDKMGETQDYLDLAKKLSNPHWGLNNTDRITIENNLKFIDSYFAKKGKTQTKDMLDQYHAYNTYANPTQEGLSKTFPIRTVASAIIGASLTPVIGPMGGMVGSLASWHMGSPEAWVPVLQGTVKK